MSAARRLLDTRRRVPPEGREEYDQEWRALRDAAGERGMRAWRFGSTGGGNRFAEFLEFGEVEPFDDPACREALGRLDRSFPPETMPSLWLSLDE
ncbi:MAG: hypothetical protein ACREKN_03870 [Longimicrobiaceae bacterium]